MPPGLGDPSPPPPCLHFWRFGVPKGDPAHPVPGVSLWGWARASPAGFGGLQTGDPRGVPSPRMPPAPLGMGLEEAEGPRSAELAPKAISERGINEHLQLVLAGVNEVLNINSAPQVLPRSPQTLPTTRSPSPPSAWLGCPGVPRCPQICPHWQLVPSLKPPGSACPCPLRRGRMGTQGRDGDPGHGMGWGPNPIRLQLLRVGD